MRELAPGCGCGPNEELPPAGVGLVPARTGYRRNSVARRGGGRTAVALLLGCGLAAGCGGGEGETPPVVGDVATLAADSASNPTVALDRRSGAAYVAWVGREAGENAVFVAAISPDGHRSEPVRANDIPGDVAPHLQAPAQVAVGPGGTVYVLWQNNTPVDGRRFPASDLRLAVSEDGGRSFRPAITVNDDAGGPPTSHTFHDIAVAGDGTVVVSWIDSRTRDAVAHQRLPAGMGHGGEGEMHHGHGSGTVAASHDHGAVSLPEGPEIRIARSLDEGRSFGASIVVDSAACPCCRTALALGEDGAILVAWRKIFPGDIRDIVVARAEPGSDRFGEPVRVHADDWVFPGCPHAGPSLAMDDAGQLSVGWYTGKEDRQGLWYAASADGGRSFGDPTAVLTGDWVPPSQLRLAVSEGRVWAAWEDRTHQSPRILAASGLAGGPLTPITGWEMTGSDPAIAASPGGARVAWLGEASVLSFQF